MSPTDGNENEERIGTILPLSFAHTRRIGCVASVPLLI